MCVGVCMHVGGVVVLCVLVCTCMLVIVWCALMGWWCGDVVHVGVCMYVGGGVVVW